MPADYDKLFRPADDVEDLGDASSETEFDVGASFDVSDPYPPHAHPAGPPRPNGRPLPPVNRPQQCVSAQEIPRAPSEPVPVPTGWPASAAPKRPPPPLPIGGPPTTTSCLRGRPRTGRTQPPGPTNADRRTPAIAVAAPNALSHDGIHASPSQALRPPVIRYAATPIRPPRTAHAPNARRRRAAERPAAARTPTGPCPERRARTRRTGATRRAASGALPARAPRPPISRRRRTRRRAGADVSFGSGASAPGCSGAACGWAGARGNPARSGCRTPGRQAPRRRTRRRSGHIRCRANPTRAAGGVAARTGESRPARGATGAQIGVTARMAALGPRADPHQLGSVPRREVRTGSAQPDSPKSTRGLSDRDPGPQGRGRQDDLDRQLGLDCSRMCGATASWRLMPIPAAATSPTGRDVLRPATIADLLSTRIYRTTTMSARTPV